MIPGYTTAFKCPGPCDRCGAMALTKGDCKTCRSKKPARPLPTYRHVKETPMRRAA